MAPRKKKATTKRKKAKAIRKTTKGKGANYRKTKSGAGMTRKGVKAYRRANPGSKLKTAVTGKVKKGSKAAKRRKSYCARSLGQKKRSSKKTQNDPNSRINQARRRWKCQMAITKAEILTVIDADIDDVTNKLTSLMSTGSLLNTKDELQCDNYTRQLALLDSTKTWIEANLQVSFIYWEYLIIMGALARAKASQDGIRQCPRETPTYMEISTYE